MLIHCGATKPKRQPTGQIASDHPSRRRFRCAPASIGGAWKLKLLESWRTKKKLHRADVRLIWQHLRFDGEYRRLQAPSTAAWKSALGKAEYAGRQMNFVSHSGRGGGSLCGWPSESPVRAGSAGDSGIAMTLVTLEPGCLRRAGR